MDLYIAISLGAETRARLGAIQERIGHLQPDLFQAAETADSLRLFLVSFTDADDECVEAVKSAMSETKLMPFELTIDKVGWSQNDGGTWWAGIEASHELLSLRDKLRGHLETQVPVVPPEECMRIILGKGPEGNFGPIDPFCETVTIIDLVRSSYVDGNLTHLCIFRKGQWKKPIVIEPYTPQWEREFRRLETALAFLLQGTSAKIHHVGSTSVPGLWAKPILDVDIEIDGMWEFPGIARRLGSLGYRHEGNYGIPGREAMKYDETEFMTHHLYVCPRDSAELSRHLLLRDYLRVNPEAVREYGGLKLSLAARHGSDIDAYIDGKSSFIEDCLRKAKSRGPASAI